jgi:hypothetical protein
MKPMTDTTLLDFDLVLDRTDDGCYCRVTKSPAGETVVGLRPTFTARELAAFEQSMADGRAHHGETPDALTQMARDYGRRLFQSVFYGSLLACLDDSERIAFQRQATLRLRFHLEAAPDLVRLPWEYLYDPARDQFLGLSAQTPTSRYFELMHRIPPVKPNGPIRILVVVAGPSTLPAISSDRRWIDLVDSVDFLGAQRRLILERLPRPTLLDLQRKLRQTQYHGIHFIGHYAPDRQTGEGQIILEDEVGRSRPISGEHLGGLLREHYDLRLVYLDGDGGGPRDGGEAAIQDVANRLVRRGLGAVLASRLPIGHPVGLTLARHFYDAVSAGQPVDVAMQQARQAIFNQHRSILWGAPTLLTRVPDGRLFGDDHLARPVLPEGTMDSIVSRFNSLRIRTATREAMSRWGMEPSPRKPGST